MRVAIRLAALLILAGGILLSLWLSGQLELGIFSWI